MAGFPSIMPMSGPITVGNECKSPYQWAALLAPKEEGKLVQYKNAMLWLEDETFGSRDEFLAKVLRIIKFQEEEEHKPTATVSVPSGISAEEDDDQSDSDTWSTPVKKKKKAKGPVVRLTKAQLAKAIVDACINELKRVFSFTGPSLNISSIYSGFKKDEFTYPQLIGAIRDEIVKLRSPSQEGFPVSSSARYNAASSAGKGKNFNFKVQRKDSSKPNGWSAVAQIHVLWQ
jgi:hypothetical protein